jgi:hypothetical protein
MNNFFNIKLVATNYTITDLDEYIGATANGIVITLPAGVGGRWYYIKNQSAGNVTVQCTGGQTIEGSAFKTLNSSAGIMTVFDGTGWIIL